jgi:hypothetical protein
LFSPLRPHHHPSLLSLLQLDSNTETWVTIDMMRNVEREVNLGWEQLDVLL